MHLSVILSGQKQSTNCNNVSASAVSACDFTEESNVSEPLPLENNADMSTKPESSEELEITRLRREVAKLQNKNKILRESLSSIFNDDQLCLSEKSRTQKRKQGKRLFYCFNIKYSKLVHFTTELPLKVMIYTILSFKNFEILQQNFH